MHWKSQAEQRKKKKSFFEKCKTLFSICLTIFQTYSISLIFKSRISLFKDGAAFCLRSQGLILRCLYIVPQCLLLTQLAQAADGGTDGDSGGGGGDVGTSSDDLVATSARPDTNVGALDGVLTAELAGVLSVLGNFDLLDLLTDGRTVTCSVLSNDTDLLSSASLYSPKLQQYINTNKEKDALVLHTLIKVQNWVILDRLKKVRLLCSVLHFRPPHCLHILLDFLFYRMRSLLEDRARTVGTKTR